VCVLDIGEIQRSELITTRLDLIPQCGYPEDPSADALVPMGKEDPIFDRLSVLRGLTDHFLPLGVLKNRILHNTD